MTSNASVKKPLEDLVVETNVRSAPLAGYMTHELRAPLTSVRSALSILQMQLEGRLKPEELDILLTALRNTDRLDRLIDDILDFDRVRMGRLEMTLEPLQPEEALQEAVDSLRSWAVAKGVRLERVETDEPMPLVRGDRRRTVQVLTNLISNAIKFTPKGGRVRVSPAPGRFEHAGTVMFKVRDTGPGIPHQDLERVFQVFEQSALGNKTGKGTGLGLTLAKAMVEKQGGRIWAESWRGLGATFIFTLPMLHTERTRAGRPYPQPVRYHGLLVGLYRRLSAVVTALVP